MHDGAMILVGVDSSRSVLDLQAKLMYIMRDGVQPNCTEVFSSSLGKLKRSFESPCSIKKELPYHFLKWHPLLTD